MKKVYTLFFVLSSLLATAQISINGPQVFGPENGGVLYPILQGSGGNFEFEGYPVPQISGMISSIDIDIDFTYSEGNTYASDLTFIISKNPNVLDSANNLIQIGGYDQLASAMLSWTCTGCGSANVPIQMINHIDLPSMIDFTDTNFIIWMGNGYMQAAAVGTWSINNITFGGSNSFVGLNDLPFDVNIYPNPTYDFVQITSEEQLSSIKLYTLTGQLTMEVFMSVMSAKIDMTNLNSGVYLCQLTSSEGQTSTIRLIKN